MVKEQKKKKKKKKKKKTDSEKDHASSKVVSARFVLLCHCIYILVSDLYL